MATTLETLLRRERAVVAASLVGLAALAWAWFLVDARHMAMAGGMPADGAIARLALGFLMWTVMMVGMMLPSAAPAILLYARVVRRAAEGGTVLPPVGLFTAAYLLVWTGFALAATLLQLALEAAALVHGATVVATDRLAGALLLAAGAWQWLPLKAACLEHCRSPLAFFAARLRPGALGALRTGAAHGLYCLGCCWALMLLLFVGGVMSPLWVAALAGLVLVEKLAPGGRLLARASGAACLLCGLWLLASAGSG